jgi:hypothetical protein
LMRSACASVRSLDADIYFPGAALIISEHS